MEKFSLAEFVQRREMNPTDLDSIINSKCEINWNECQIATVKAEMQFQNKVDMLYVKGKENLFPIRAGKKILLSTSTWRKPLSSKRMKLEKKERTFHMGKTIFGEDVFLIVSNVTKEDLVVRKEEGAGETLRG
jgi:hypothetical protein